MNLKLKASGTKNTEHFGNTLQLKVDHIILEMKFFHEVFQN